MQMIKLNNGTRLPSIGLGTWQIDEGEDVRQAVDEALKAGYRLIDTAKIYGNEIGVGDAIRSSGLSREEVFVTTKLWGSDQGYQSALEAFDVSLHKLGLEYIDLYLIHWPADDKQTRFDSWRALIELQSAGKAKAIGVSNYKIEHLEELQKDSDVLPAVNQVEFHPLIYESHKPILDYCKQNDIAFEAYSPLARANLVENDTVQLVGEEVGKTPAQVLVRWSIQHGTIPLPKSGNPGRIRENLDVEDFELSDQQMEKLNQLSAGTSIL